MRKLFLGLVRVRLLREKKGEGLLSVVEWGPRVFGLERKGLSDRLGIGVLDFNWAYNNNNNNNNKYQ